MTPLTKRQRAVLDAIAAWIKKHGYSPNYKEIGAAVGVRSLATVACHLQRLRDKGYIHYGWNQTRSIEIISASVRGWNFCDTGHDLVYFEGPGCPCCGLIINLPASVRALKSCASGHALCWFAGVCPACSIKEQQNG